MSADRGTHPVRIVVIGHTNAGKTSLLRTLTRDRNFGEVSIHPATTREAEAARLDLPDGLALVFIDTPGFEDSIGLLDWLHRQEPDPRTPGPERLTGFLNSAAAHAEFTQEAKAMRQLLQCDLAYYVADATEPVSGKYQDEFIILNWSGKPVLAVLNFVAGAVQTAAWREALRNAGLHNVAEFDTVVFNQRDEERLLLQTAMLLPAAENHMRQLLALRDEERRRQLAAAAVLIAVALSECAQVHAAGPDAAAGVRRQARDRERLLNQDLLALFRFTAEDYAPDELPIRGAQWSIDLFDAAVLKDIGLSLGGSAAKGAAAGAAVDLVTGVTTLGMATLIGGVIGAGINGANRIRNYLRYRPGAGASAQVGLEGLCHLARRACLLVRDLARRGHAAVRPVATVNPIAVRLIEEPRIAALLQRMRYRPRWAGYRSESRETRRREELQALIRKNLPEE
jgi:GTPase Era involved in 16S rRNA processing